MRQVDCDDILSQYSNVTLIHRGGQRVVYQIDHPTYGKAALKVGAYKTPTNQEGWDIERIEREIEIYKQIDSPYYPKNYSFEKVSQGRYIIIEEFVDSIPLTKCMDKFQQPLDVMNLIKHLATGLNVIWNKNIIHRDLKPDNILINSDGSPTIIDLGIARSIDNTSLTKTMLGGPCSMNYAAPEQLRYNKRQIDFRTDQYNIGIILVQLLLKGIHPFDPTIVGGDSIPQNIMKDNWHRQIFDDDNLRPIFPVTQKCLGHQPYQRYRTCEMMMKAINSCMENYT